MAQKNAAISPAVSHFERSARGQTRRGARKRRTRSRGNQERASRTEEIACEQQADDDGAAPVGPRHDAREVHRRDLRSRRSRRARRRSRSRRSALAASSGSAARAAVRRDRERRADRNVSRRSRRRAARGATAMRRSGGGESSRSAIVARRNQIRDRHRDPHQQTRERLLVEHRERAESRHGFVAGVEHAIREHEERRQRGVLEIGKEEIGQHRPARPARARRPGLHHRPPEEQAGDEETGVFRRVPRGYAQREFVGGGNVPAPGRRDDRERAAQRMRDCFAETSQRGPREERAEQRTSRRPAERRAAADARDIRAAAAAGATAISSTCCTMCTGNSRNANASRGDATAITSVATPPRNAASRQHGKRARHAGVQVAEAAQIERRWRAARRRQPDAHGPRGEDRARASDIALTARARRARSPASLAVRAGGIRPGAAFRGTPRARSPRTDSGSCRMRACCRRPGAPAGSAGRG